MMRMKLAAAVALAAGNLTAQGEDVAKQVDPSFVSLSAVKGVESNKTDVTVVSATKGSVPLEVKVVGKDAESFHVSKKKAGGSSEAKSTLGVEFKPTGKAGLYSAEVQIGPKQGGTTVVLHGVATDALEGENEPPLERIVQALGIPLDVGGSDLKLGTEPPVVGASIPAKQFRRAGVGPVRMTPVARYSPPGAYPFGWQAGGDEQVVGTLADSKGVADAHQRLFPPLAEGGESVKFSPGDEAFALFIRAGKHTVGTDKAKHPSKLANPARVYPVEVFQGRPVENAFLVGFEEASNGDYQDSVFLLENVKVAETD